MSAADASYKYLYAVNALKAFRDDMKQESDRFRRAIDRSKKTKWSPAIKYERELLERSILENDKSIASCDGAIELLEREMA